MNKWFVIYCVYTMYTLTRDMVVYTKSDDESTKEWIIALTFLLLSVFKIGIVYFAIRQGF